MRGSLSANVYLILGPTLPTQILCFTKVNICQISVYDARADILMHARWISFYRDYMLWRL